MRLKRVLVSFSDLHPLVRLLVDLLQPFRHAVRVDLRARGVPAPCRLCPSFRGSELKNILVVLSQNPVERHYKMAV